MDRGRVVEVLLRIAAFRDLLRSTSHVIAMLASRTDFGHYKILRQKLSENLFVAQMVFRGQNLTRVKR